ncbi:chemotaxis protein CheA [Fulvivirgaceae bacterium BMA10]|uniref:Chemotaxis protein CheA n=1 Tax=Splendidivirga corallicola TaxID=3051826 RepID=A0ABT8KSS7_9BACT|nr:chemotaxis protein CheA [Fulvivirgaceae bacterium BMA10]
MKSKEQEYKEIFLAEAIDNHVELNKLLTQLEKKPDDKSAVDAIFRITHTLKGNAAGMGFKDVAEFAHLIEDLFGGIREAKISLNPDLFGTIFKSIDVLGQLIEAVRDNKKVRFLGIKTKLGVILKSTGKQKSATKKTQPKRNSLGKPKSKKIEDTPKQENSKDQPIEEADVEEDGIAKNKVAFSDLVQVPVKKLDNLLNLVGELIIERDRIIATSQSLNTSNEYARLNRISSDLQYSVMDVRLVQVGFLFNKFHRVVRDVAAVENKKVNLTLEGTETEIDRNILQIISDSLIHLIRNAVGHGLEIPDERKKVGKKEEGELTLKAYAENDAVFIEIKDDGKGIDINKVRKKAMENGLITHEEAKEMADRDIALLIFEPGFSTMDDVTSIAGRGVGMDVVKKALDAVVGTISVDTKQGKGTTFTLRLPSSMAVKGTLLFELDQEEYAIPLSYTESVVSLYRSEIHKVGNRLAAVHSGQTISIVFLKDLFDSHKNVTGNILHRTFDQLHPEQKLDIVVISHNGKKAGFVVDKLFQQKEIVEKPLSKPVDKSIFFSGVTIMGNGNACLVLNVAAICNLIFSRNLSGQGKITY